MHTDLAAHGPGFVSGNPICVQGLRVRWSLQNGANMHASSGPKATSTLHSTFMTCQECSSTYHNNPPSLQHAQNPTFNAHLLCCCPVCPQLVQLLLCCQLILLGLGCGLTPGRLSGTRLLSKPAGVEGRWRGEEGQGVWRGEECLESSADLQQSTTRHPNAI